MSTKEINLQVMDDVEMITENFSLHIYGTYILKTTSPNTVFV